MEALSWSLFGLVAAGMTAGFGLLTTAVFRLGDRIDHLSDHLSDRIDAQGAYLGARIDAVNARIDAGR